MPFDALVLRSPRTLADAVVDLGITPIPAEVLAEHKRTEQAKYPPASILYPYIAVMRLGIGIIAMLGLLCGILGLIGIVRTSLIPTPHNAWATLTLLCLCMAGMIGTMCASLKVIRGPAEWVESTPSFLYADVPNSIMFTALRLTSVIPEANIVIGELQQNNVILDPYLIVRTPTEQVCLGIWQGDTILHQA